MGGILHHGAHNLQLTQVNDRVGLSEAQRDRNIVVIVIGPADLQSHKGELHMWAHVKDARLLDRTVQPCRQQVLGCDHTIMQTLYP